MSDTYPHIAGSVHSTQACVSIAALTANGARGPRPTGKPREAGARRVERRRETEYQEGWRAIGRKGPRGQTNHWRYNQNSPQGRGVSNAP